MVPYFYVSFEQEAYVPFAAVCYWVFGSQAQAPILLNLEGGFVKASSVFAILLNVVISYPVVLKTVEDAIEVLRLYIGPYCLDGVAQCMCLLVNARMSWHAML